MRKAAHNFWIKVSNSGKCSVVSGRKWLIGEAVVNDAVPMVFILSRIARIVDQKKEKIYIVIKYY